jgi:hypothetical protein
MGRVLGITAVAVGRILELLGYRSNKHVTDSAVAAGCGVRRWDGYAMHDDWHLDRAVYAIKSAAESPGEPGVADALAAAIANQQERDRAAARKREQEETAAACRQEEEAVISALRVELRALLNTDPGMTLLTAVEFVTSPPTAASLSSDVVVLRIEVSNPVAWLKTTTVVWRSPRWSPTISPSLNAEQGPKAIRDETVALAQGRSRTG